jgi:phospholipase A1
MSLELFANMRNAMFKSNAFFRGLCGVSGFLVALTFSPTVAANTPITTISCEDLNGFDERQLNSVLFMTYAHVATLHGMEVQLGAHSDLAIDQAKSACRDKPELQLITALEAAIVVDEKLPEQTELVLQQDETIATPVELRRAQETLALNNPFALNPHRPNYILPATFADDLDFSPYGPFEPFLTDSEIKFQLSLKSQLASNLVWGSSLEVGYTQLSFWQLYADDEASAPFRETNYEPELLWRIPLDLEVFGFQARLATLAFTHQSNGQIRPISRSWNRVSGEILLERGNWVISAQARTRVDDPEFDDNPNVADFMGRLNLGLGYKTHDHTFTLGIKNGMGSRHKAGAEFNWLFPLSGKFHGHFQLYHGYGENLIDMENKNTRIGLGVALSSWF